MNERLASLPPTLRPGFPLSSSRSQVTISAKYRWLLGTACLSNRLKYTSRYTIGRLARQINPLGAAEAADYSRRCRADRRCMALKSLWVDQHNAVNEIVKGTRVQHWQSNGQRGVSWMRTRISTIHVQQQLNARLTSALFCDPKLIFLVYREPFLRFASYVPTGQKECVRNIPVGTYWVLCPWSL